MPGIVANLVPAVGASVRKLYFAQSSITGVGVIGTGLQAIESGSVLVTVANSGSGFPFDVATVNQISGGYITVTVVQLGQSGATIKETAAFQVNTWAVGR